MRGEEKWKNSRINLQPFNRNLSGKFLLQLSNFSEIILNSLDPVFIHSYKNYGSGPTKYPLADMLQFVLEFATTKPTSVSPAEDLRPASPTAASHPLDDPSSKENRLSTQRTR